MDDDHIEALLAEGIATGDWERRREIAAELTQGDPEAAFPLAVRMLRSGDGGAAALGGELIADRRPAPARVAGHAARPRLGGLPVQRDRARRRAGGDAARLSSLMALRVGVALPDLMVLVGRVPPPSSSARTARGGACDPGIS